VRVNVEPGLFDEGDEVHVSTLFTWDKERSEQLAAAWEKVAHVKMGGPAWGNRGENFNPGEYVKNGYVITSRGCPNRCWFCSVWRREGSVVRELPIADGWNVLDDNLLACSEAHIKRVFAMLGRQARAPEFTGGLEAARLTEWHAEEMKRLHTKQAFFAYDTPDDLEPLRAAGNIMLRAGFTRQSHALRCFVLIGYPKDSMGDAERRLSDALDAGFTPMAMLWRDELGETRREWRAFQREWARPAIIHSLTDREGEK
jgi:hypothetical protein